MSADKPLCLDRLDADRVVETVAKLSQRVRERFPQAGLAAACEHLLAVARKARARADWISRPVWWVRVLGIAAVILIVAGSALMFAFLEPPEGRLELLPFFQTFEAGINNVVLIGAAVFFLVTLEKRIKRRRALEAIHELRALAHIIDMHQLTKAPERLMRKKLFTASSPRESMTAFELGRYLDYCTEMLSLTGKLAALMVQRFDDPVVLEAASDMENLSTGLSRKIWQKIAVLQTMQALKDDARN